MRFTFLLHRKFFSGRNLLVLDMLSPDLGLAGKDFPEKIEGIAFGPKLADGSRVLIVASDNDFRGDQDTEIYAFSVK